MLLLTIESSCDETAAAVVRDGRQVLSNIVASQVDVHARYGGVVPELASRKHLEAISVVVDEALQQAGVTLDDIEGLAVTRGPGLVGALLVGLSVAKAIAFARNLPLVGVHHIEGHILAPLLEHEVAFPYLALAVSGGHTHLYRVDGIGCYRTLGRTLDDAAGEAFDKVAKLLGLGYPGGVQIDRLAAKGNSRAIDFPRPMLHRKNLDFSFSGIKTAVLNQVNELHGPMDMEALQDLAASFQAAVVEVLCKKTLRAAKEEGLNRIVVAGGVACNSGLRAEMTRLC
ncbi:MAG: tRNA (adenosine(37)-N6)-threonylcarbamoyltransferase complex transferase subunit TsaD, partial [Desulfuromonadaceae bacterium]